MNRSLRYLIQKVQLRVTYFHANAFHTSGSARPRSLYKSHARRPPTRAPAVRAFGPAIPEVTVTSQKIHSSPEDTQSTRPHSNIVN